MIGFGWFLSIVGAVLSGFGLIAENNISESHYGLGAYTRGEELADAQTCLTIGIIVLAVGVILLVAGYIRRSIEVKQYLDSRYMNRMREQPKDTSLLDTKRCTNCGFVGNKDDAFCPKCGKKL